MRWLILFGLCIIIIPCTTLAKTMYITDNIKITMRRGAGMAYKVIAEPESGQVIEILENSPPWTKVRLPEGKEGWVRTQFLTSTQPKKVQLNLLKTKMESLTQKADMLSAENKKLKAENKKLAVQAAENMKERKNAVESYENLKKESQDYLTVKKGYEQASLQLKQEKAKADKLEAELQAWKGDIILFGIGGSLLLTGFILGWIYAGNRGKSRNSYLR